jgi:DNA-directed RNA polymerase subunit omega
MLYPPINELIEKAGSRYALVIAASKRARDIVEGSDPLVKTASTKPVSIATLEIYEDKIEVIKEEGSEYSFD